jgi:hypothetical protein
MTMRSRREVIQHPFQIKGSDRVQPPGAHDVITDEQMIEGLSAVESQLLSAPAASWPEAAAKARHVLNSYAAGLAAHDTHHRDLVTAVLADFDRLSNES